MQLVNRVIELEECCLVGIRHPLMFIHLSRMGEEEERLKMKKKKGTPTIGVKRKGKKEVFLFQTLWGSAPLTSRLYFCICI